MTLAVFAWLTAGYVTYVGKVTVNFKLFQQPQAIFMSHVSTFQNSGNHSLKAIITITIIMLLMLMAGIICHSGSGSGFSSHRSEHLSLWDQEEANEISRHIQMPIQTRHVKRINGACDYVSVKGFGAFSGDAFVSCFPAWFSSPSRNGRILGWECFCFWKSPLHAPICMS